MYTYTYYIPAVAHVYNIILYVRNNNDFSRNPRVKSNKRGYRIFLVHLLSYNIRVYTKYNII